MHYKFPEDNNKDMSTSFWLKGRTISGVFSNIEVHEMTSVFSL